MATKSTATPTKATATPAGKKNTNRTLPSGRVLTIYAEHEDKSHSEFIHALMAAGGYANKRQAQARLSRLRHLLKKRGVQLKRLRGAPSLPKSQEGLTTAFSSILTATL
jgi:type IV pilus biogenesis protein CpaD/CtpE